MEHPIENIMDTTLQNIRDMIDVNTIVGEPFEAVDGTVIIPVSRVGFGFVAGGGEYKDSVSAKKKDNEDMNASTPPPFAGGTGAGVSIRPVSFVVISKNGEVKLLSSDFHSPYDRIIEAVPHLLGEIKNFFTKVSDDAEADELEEI